FQFPQPVGQHLLRHVRHAAPQVAEPHRPVLQEVQDERLPLAADHVEGRLDRAVVLVHCGILFGTTALFSAYLWKIYDPGILPTTSEVTGSWGCLTWSWKSFGTRSPGAGRRRSRTPTGRRRRSSPNRRTAGATNWCGASRSRPGTSC